jgi:hypothetical protein
VVGAANDQKLVPNRAFAPPVGRTVAKLAVGVCEGGGLLAMNLGEMLHSVCHSLSSGLTGWFRRAYGMRARRKRVSSFFQTKVLLSISRNVARLEAGVGGRLSHRTSRKVELTAAGYAVTAPIYFGIRYLIECLHRTRRVCRQ